ncbi:hypothetical protein N657DRAFT_689935 [Parathielavia appendiculata]|uniref:Clr5 domain-containing protein n=1 Tax=Parathielavia appendiculata TaxID=2587402 RepID=A0AAN6U0V7_9PEZI|nr:hypothetical protein N657DRAFT_689935 [Parathielavia appendiculata]
MDRSASPDGRSRALLAQAENVTGLVLDEDAPVPFIKEESLSPVPDDPGVVRMPSFKVNTVSPTQKSSGTPAGKASGTQQKSGRHGGKGGSSKAGILKAAKAIQVPGQPIIPRKVQDWEPWKGVLYELYITQNRILRDIIDIMETKHNVRATPKMYKNQFARWGFFKYSIKGRPRAKAESPTDLSSSDDSLDGAIVLSRDELLHADGGSRSIQAGLTAVRRFLQGHIDRDPANLQVEEVAGFVDPCYRYFKVAMDLFDLKENVEGGRVLRLAFLQIERKISKPTMKSFSDLCFLVPHLLLESNRRDILSAYLHYLSALATVKFGRHPVADLAASFASLVDDRPQDMMRYIMLLSQINSDTIASLPGMLDRNREWARNQYLACQRTANTTTTISPHQSPSPGRGDGIIGAERHDHHMIRLEAQSVYWAQKLVMQDQESDAMAAQWLRRRFEPNFGPRCERYLAQLRERAAQGGFPVMFARMMETLMVGWLYDYYETVQDWERAFEWGRRGLELSTDEQYAIWSIHLEGLMESSGRAEEAEELRRRRREHAWLERVRLEVDRLSIADG